jgi:hypothetical protein
MIPQSVQLQLDKLDPNTLTVLDSDHALPVDPWAVEHYAQLLTEQPDHDTDPLLVLRDPSGLLRVRRGRHRLLANRQAGRPYVLAMVYDDA